MTRPVYDDDPNSRLHKAGWRGVDLQHRPLAGRWNRVRNSGGPEVVGKGKVQPELQNGWAQPAAASDLAQHEFRLHMDGSLEFKGHLVPGTWDSLVYTLPGANEAEPNYIPTHEISFLNDVFDSAADQFQVGRVVIYPELDSDGNPHPNAGEVWIFRVVNGIAVYEIKVFEDENVVLAGDGAFYWPIPQDLDAAEIILIEGGISTPSSSGSVQVQVAHSVGDANGPWSDVLTTKVTIPAGDYNDDETAAVSGGAWSVANGDWLRIDVDAAGVGAKGLAMMVALTPSPLGSVTVQGAKGDPGGIINWTGPWSAVTTYAADDAVSHNGSSYVALQGSTDVEPGVDPGWEAYWMLLAGGHTVSEVVFTVDGKGYVIDTGPKQAIPVYFPCTIVEATLLADIAGSAVVDIWKASYGAYPPTDADSITGASPPTLSAANKMTDTALTGWTTAIAAGDVLLFNVDSVTGIRRLSVTLKVTR